ncbi:hypothetical protein SynPROS71_01719 [Synechococcus sp. PROS-7-1]|nr:hypothetical protein SynPROS71_01719 [Synechococcus sp. PROS-7-1]
MSSGTNHFHPFCWFLGLDTLQCGLRCFATAGIFSSGPRILNPSLMQQMAR